MHARTQTRQAPPAQAQPTTPPPAASQPVAPREPALPEPVARRGINEAQWRTMVNSLYPGADVNSVLMVWDYCMARKLDPLKKPCHIVPIEVKDSKTGTYVWRDVVMPGIYELRTTATRTELYLGHSEPTYGPVIEIFGIEAPAWCSMTMYRWHELSEQRIEFPVRVLFAEVCATKRDKQSGKPVANARWTRSPVQMMTKCCEGAGLREAFPDEIGGQHAAEEMEGRTFDVELAPAPQGKPTTTAPQARAETQTEVTHVPVEELRGTIDRLGIPESEFCAHFEIGAVDELPLNQVANAREYLAGIERSLAGG
jgi:phage recombination protein Bet